MLQETGCSPQGACGRFRVCTRVYTHPPSGSNIFPHVGLSPLLPLPGECPAEGLSLQPLSQHMVTLQFWLSVAYLIVNENK